MAAATPSPHPTTRASDIALVRGSHATPGQARSLGQGSFPIYRAPLAVHSSQFHCAKVLACASCTGA